MYRYDEFDHRLLSQRIDQFRDQVARRLSGQLDEDAFRPLRLRNGVYLQLNAYMLRVNIPYGLLSSVQMRRLADIAERYDRGYGHFSTRQNIQFNWPRLVDIPDMLAALAEVEMHAMQSSGNCIRNITADHLAGIAADEVADPRPYCEIIRQWSTLHPEFSFLPRKFKIAVSGASRDRAAVHVHDIGIRIVRNEAGETGFHILVGGGLGRTPVIGKTLREFLPEADLLSYLEAVLRVYNRHGRRDNKYKARIKILVNDLGIEAFAALVEEEWQRLRHSALRLGRADIERMKAHFPRPDYLPPANDTSEYEALRRDDPAFGRWARNAVFSHRQPGYGIVMVSLKRSGRPTGDMRADEMRAMARLADEYGFGEIRVTHRQNLVLPDVPLHRLPSLWRELAALDLATPNHGLLSDIIACPGMDYCSLATARSIPVAQAIAERFEDLDYLHDIGDLSLNISGCINSCAHHNVANIGILGVDKRGQEVYQITLGGSSGDDASIGKRIGPALPAEKVPEAIEGIVDAFLAEREGDERFIDTYRRVGDQPFKERVYA